MTTTTRTNFNAKDERVERGAATYLRSLGMTARRGQQYAGGPDSPDVIVADLPRVHIEVKGVRGMDVGTALLNNAMAQADRDAGRHSEPVVLWKPPRKPWRLTWIERGVQLTTTGDAEVTAVLDRLNRRGCRLSTSHVPLPRCRHI